jgi:cytochrome c oxidase cbb3-type subunit 4
VDINLLRSVVTICAFVLFVGILVWAYLPARRALFEDAAKLPFREEE